jgi:putative ABC transport system substrate-binding protein
MIKRREFITLLGGAAAAWPLAARAQQPERMRRIGVFMPLAADDKQAQARLAAFLQGLQELGWTDGRNVRIDYRWAAGDAERIRRYAVELAALAPDVILAGGAAVVPSLLQATRTVPIVFTQTPDPVGAGFVNSLARPGGNVTGFLVFEYGISAKWLELLKEIAPRVTRAAVIRDAAIASGTGQWGALQSVAPSFGVEFEPGQHARCRRDRTRYCGLRALPERRRDPDGERVGDDSSRPDHHAGGPAQAARGLLRPPLRHTRRPDLLRA